MKLPSSCQYTSKYVKHFAKLQARVCVFQCVHLSNHISFIQIYKTNERSAELIEISSVIQRKLLRILFTLLHFQRLSWFPVHI